MQIRHFTLGMAGVLVLSGVIWLFTSTWRSAQAIPARSPNSPVNPALVRLEKADLWLRPESERPLDRLIVGIEERKPEYFLLPSPAVPDGISPQQVQEVERQLYWLTTELAHGAIFRHLPGNTHMYVALPKTADSLGGERDLFIAYLQQRCGWTSDDVRQRVHFFDSPVPLIWSRDSSLILGYDDDHRAVVAVGAKNYDNYRTAIRSLVNTFPDQFVALETNEPITTVGGDLELVWMPDGRVALLAGYNRVKDYVIAVHDFPFDDAVVPSELVEECRAVYSRALFDLPVIFLPERSLFDMDLRHPELFHLDMIAAVLSQGGRSEAFVPEYRGDPQDSLEGLPLDPELVRRAEAEYDAAAEELARHGFKVHRLAYADDPVRSPVNVGKFLNRQTGRYTVLLSKYPARCEVDGQPSAQQLMRDALFKLEELAHTAVTDNTVDNYRRYAQAITQLWDTVDRVSAMPNPEFDLQAEQYRARGYDVIPVADFAWGGGAIHCQTLH